MTVSTLKGVIRGGQVVLPQPANLPDGTEVLVQPLALDDEGPVSPEEIARTLAAMERVQPFDMTEEEEAVLAADRQARKEWERVHFNPHADKLRELWP